ncbi:Cysteine-rich membrane protein 2 [Spironucleus salmonicida]|uniref:Cysteine-rich membrane protein 2 n=1 Tax=Spironucleus salmonicida TaxID=348837 RepID=V6LR39_9EUKA|nr:Cysteine-rich membrane protein 2 [Spironucleus salmonicida]|eukprot:EST46693.1 Cysteine-rich membrane protein 2 [Spironucleus salmonicida]
MFNCSIENCETCMMSEIVCDFCKEGFLLLKNTCVESCPETHFVQHSDMCQLCAWSSPGCTICAQADPTKDDVTCSACYSNFTLNGTACDCAITNCSVCEPLIENQCKICTAPDYFLNNKNVCEACTTLPNCRECFQSHVGVSCEVCVEKFVSVNGSCVPVPPNCIESAKERPCVRCADGFALTQEYQCEACLVIPECTKCSFVAQKLTCSGCATDFLIIANKCVPVAPNCAVVTESNTCEKCNDGFALNTANACGTCDAIIDFASPACACGVAENCGNCGKDLDACGACLGSFEMKDGKCVQGACAVANCETCRDRPDSCMACAGGFQLTILDSCQESCAGVGQNGQFCRAGAARAAEWVACPADATGVAQMLTDCICGSAENCGNCSAEGQCGACLPGYQQRNGSCTECADGFLRQPSNGLCVKKTEEASNKLSTGAVAGIVIGVLVVAALAIGCVVYFRMRKRAPAATPLELSHQTD